MESPFPVLFIVIISVAGICNGVYLSASEVNADCIAILTALPTYHWSNPENFAFLKIRTGEDSEENDDRERIANYLFNQCMYRYHQLSAQSSRNHGIMRGFENRSSIPMDKSNLIILDVDETIIDQRAMSRSDISISSNDLKTYFSSDLNRRDLVFGVRTHDDERRRMIPHFIVFRAFLMKFIYENLPSSNFVIYSLADPSFVIYHIVLIEMYFNYVTRLSPRYRDASVFDFDYVIGRLPDRSPGRILNYKSLLILDALIGDLTQFDTIHIVDDMAGYVWKHDFPETFIQNGTSSTKIYPFQAATFVVDMKSANIELECAYIRYQRGQDTFFRDLLSMQRLIHDYGSQSGMKDGTLEWMHPDEVQFPQFLIHNLQHEYAITQKTRSNGCTDNMKIEYPSICVNQRSCLLGGSPLSANVVKFRKHID